MMEKTINVSKIITELDIIDKVIRRFYFDVVMKKAHYNHIHKPLDVLPSKFKDIF